mmetsp:Transcript_27506/g.31528  ORF Transcript_27506/g.31528 Transcript_27506/m.31528 type:complete len:673 (-) Transcript_27506:168-2186(-)
MLFSSKTITAVAALCATTIFHANMDVVDALGCKGGDTYNGGGDGCNLNDVTCTQDSCEDMGGEWTEDCPAPAADCDPLAPSDEDPSCTGPPVFIDRFGKKMYRRKIIQIELPFNDPGVGGVYTHFTVELCDDETSITQGVDTGFGDYYRLAPVPEDVCDVTNWNPKDGINYSSMHNCEGARSYSPVNPLNEHAVQFIIKLADSGDGSNYDCTPNVDCQFGFSEYVAYLKVGDYLLMSKEPDQAGTPDSTHYVYTPNYDYTTPGAGPYTINIIGQGVALTELNINAFSQLLNPQFPNGEHSNIKEINYLWANSYWNSSSWMFDKMGADMTDVSRTFIQDGLKHGIRFNLMHSISREQVPQAEWPRTNPEVIGEAFNLVNTTDQDPNIKWFVVGSSGYKKSLYPQVVSWGFDMQPCSPSAAKKGYPYCGPNSLYEWEAPGAEGLTNRPRSMMYEYYDSMEDLPTEDIPTTAISKGFTTLVGALQTAHLDVLLADPPNPGPLTVFAPSNAAFAKLGDDLLICLSQPEYVLVLQDILNYHYTYGKVLAGDLSSGQVITMANGKDITINIDDSLVYINECPDFPTGCPFVQITDVMATNGVIHAIDTVLLPPDVDVAGFLDMCLATDPPEPTPAPQPEPTPAPTPELTPEPTPKPTRSSKSSKKTRRSGSTSKSKRY